MADTSQSVSWAIKRECPFRFGENWQLPGNTFVQLADLRNVAAAASDNRIVEGTCVTSWMTERDNSGNEHRIPYSGFNVEERLGHIGGLDRAFATCRSCEANLPNEIGFDLAGCFGSLDVWPESKELDEQLWQAASKLGLEDRLRSAFPITKPLWYGFWIDSPLRRPQTELLHELIGETCDPIDPVDKDVRHFLKALEVSIRWELPVHVSLAPLGHTDFGFYTVFPHCPRCKANAPVGRWKESYPTTPHECLVCGNTFIPNEHHQSIRDDLSFDDISLEKTLGDEKYWDFVRTFLANRGGSPWQVEEVIDNRCNGPILRRIKTVRQKRNATLNAHRQTTETACRIEPASTLMIPLAEKINLELVIVPSGKFWMGSSALEEIPNEAPKHRVRINRPFYIGKFPLTQAQWTAIMGQNPSRHQGDPRLPVDQVSWFDCQEFCDRLCDKFNRLFRLPSEAEWEYACRAGTTTKYAFGDVLLPTQANFTPFKDHFGGDPTDAESMVQALELAADTESSAGRHSARPLPVGSFPPNAWGIYDMHGNVDEWCDDAWHPTYNGAPTDGSAWIDNEDKEAFRVVRGGWPSATEFVCTSSSRRQLRADAGSREDEGEFPKIDSDELDFLNDLLEMAYTPLGFRVVCEC